MIGLWTSYGTDPYAPYWNTVGEQILAYNEYVRGVSLNKMTLDNKETLHSP